MVITAALTLLQKTQQEIRAAVEPPRRGSVTTNTTDASKPRRNQPIQLDPVLLLTLPLQQAEKDLRELTVLLDDTRFLPSRLLNKQHIFLPRNETVYTTLENQNNETLARIIKIEERVIGIKEQFVSSLLEDYSLQSVKNNSDLEFAKDRVKTIKSLIEEMEETKGRIEEKQNHINALLLKISQIQTKTTHPKLVELTEQLEQTNEQIADHLEKLDAFISTLQTLLALWKPFFEKFHLETIK